MKACANKRKTRPGMERHISNQTPLPTTVGAKFVVAVQAVRREADSIMSFVLVHPEGALLPAFTAGAHIEVHLTGGHIRQYSLCGDPAERGDYQIAVLREPAGRGGSQAMHLLKAGDRLMITVPRNNFPLAGPEANSHLLLAGGIGVTPMMAMIHELEARRTDYRMHYCTRSPATTAFSERLAPLIKAGKVIVHHDGGDPAKGLDIAGTLASFFPTQHVYVCGPRGFMAAAKAATGFWPPHCVHFEHFTAPEPTQVDAAWDARPFQVKIKRTGKVIDVPAHTSVVNALRDAGLEVETSCEEGICGTCITRYVDGQPVHRDSVLSEDQRQTYVMICRARSKTPMLVLDI